METIETEIDYVKHILKSELKDSWKNTLIDLYLHSDNGRFYFNRTTYQLASGRSVKTINSTIEESLRAGLITITGQERPIHNIEMIINFVDAP